MRLKDKLAVVTGGGSGIGEAVAASLAQEGATVVTMGRDASKLEQSRGQAPVPEKIFPRAVDVSDRAAVRAAFDGVRAEHGDPDILVNSAGVNIPNRWLTQLSSEDFDFLVDVNLKGAFYCIQEVLAGMRAKGGGLIINIASIAGVRANNLSGTAYTASKFGMSGLSRQVGMEEREHGIRCCAVYPGEVNTPILDKRPEVPSPERRAAMLQPEDLAAACLMVATLPPRASIPELVITPTIQAYP